jgi:hypothetical protein
MFILLLVFVLSFVVEVLLFLFTSPLHTSNVLSHLPIIFFSLNTGIVLGTLLSLLLIIFYLKLDAYDELQSKSFLRRGLMFGILVSSLLLSKLYSILDIPVFILLLLIFIVSDVLFSRKK